MRRHIEHATIFTYAQPVREAIGEARLRPRDDAGQRLVSFQLALDPPAPLDIVADRFGKTIHCYSVLPPHQRMVVTAPSAAPLIAAPPLTSMQRHDFNAASRYVPVTAPCWRSRDHAPANIGATGTAQALMEAIYTSCAYELGSTDISTTAAVVLAERLPLAAPLAIYEVHVGSWRRAVGNRQLTYGALLMEETEAQP